MQFCHLAGESGTLCVQVYSGGGSAGGDWLLHVPAFADEMNKSRPMVARAARAFAEAGYTVVVVDLFGCGDSPGELRDATWSGWKADLKTILAWMRANGAIDLSLWGLRLGCLLAAELATEPGVRISRLLLWQPVAVGKQYITQFLRLRVAASMLGPDAETTASLRQLIDAVGSTEIAGYELSRGLVASIDQAELASLILPAGMPVIWLEVVDNAERGVSPAARNVGESWRSYGVSLETDSVQGERFWTTQEIALAPVLIARSVEALDNHPGAGGAAVDAPPPDEAGKSLVGAERACVFVCEGERLVACFHAADSESRRGVVLVVGGPQYRVGSHRQFVHFARALAAAGIPVLRFDYRGMGDSEGALRDFESVHEDIAAAVDHLQTLSPAIEECVLVGLCDAATAVGFYASSDPRIVGLVLMNPWVRSAEGQARTLLRHYYLKRLFSRRFWTRTLVGRTRIGASLASLLGNVARAKSRGRTDGGDAVTAPGGGALASRLEHALLRYSGRVLLVLSGNDLTAAEFRDTLLAPGRLAPLERAGRLRQVELAEADHTFSRRSWKDRVAEESGDWIKAL